MLKSRAYLFMVCMICWSANTRGAELRVPLDYPTIGAAFAAAASGDTIVVFAGLYRENLDWAGRDLTVRARSGPEQTILQGVTGNVVNMASGEISGFTITGGFLGSQGSAIEVSGSARIIDNVIEGNIGDRPGLRSSFGTPIIQGNVFRNNTCNSVFGLLDFQSSSEPRVINNLFVDNSCTVIDLALSSEYHPAVMNNTFVGNERAVFIDNSFGSEHYYRNNIIVANLVGLEVDDDAVPPIWENNLVWNNGTGYVGIPDQTGTGGNVAVDPLFFDIAGGDVHLMVGSPAIDSGTNALAPLNDFDGGVRPADGNGDGSRITDIGADEYGTGFGPYPPATTVHVDSSNTRVTGDGSRTRPFRTIQEAVAAAYSGDQVGVAAGVYTGTVTMRNDIDVVGSGAPTTTLNAQRSGPNVICAAAVLEGFTLARGGDPAAVDCANGASMTIADNVVSENLARSILLSRGANAVIVNNDLSANPDFTDLCPCDAIVATDSSPWIQGNRIHAADPAGNISAIDLEYQNGFIAPSFVIRDNFLEGRIFINSVPVDADDDEVIANNVVLSEFSDGLNIASGDVGAIVNNTIVGYGGIFLQGGSVANVVNNNVVATLGIEDCSDPGTVIQFNNIFQSELSRGCVPVPIGENGNISVDPLFVDVGQRDFHLAASSLLIDAGSSLFPGLPDSDYDGLPRAVGSGVDIGAFEYQLVDFDGDGVFDLHDNCSNVGNPDQRDSNGDLFGNICDPDLDDDGIVNTIDLVTFRRAAGSRPGLPNWNPHADFNGDGIVNGRDLRVLRSYWLAAPGPSGLQPVLSEVRGSRSGGGTGW
jgi:hypothetical protein